MNIVIITPILWKPEPTCMYSNNNPHIMET